MLCKKDFSFVCLTGFLFSFPLGRTGFRLPLDSVFEGRVTRFGTLPEGFETPGCDGRAFPV